MRQELTGQARQAPATNIVYGERRIQKSSPIPKQGTYGRGFAAMSAVVGAGDERPDRQQPSRSIFSDRSYRWPLFTRTRGTRKSQKHATDESARLLGSVGVKEMKVSNCIELEHPLTESEAATLLLVAPKTLRNWRVQGKGPKFLKSGGRVGYLPSYIRDYQNANIRRSTSDKAGDCD